LIQINPQKPEIKDEGGEVLPPLSFFKRKGGSSPSPLFEKTIN
jgi:hypothetical protein